MPDFADLLSTGRGTFWVSGKAGPGKSTLMKFIAGHSQTERLLNKWARPGICIIGSHFFWNAGSLLQKYQEGLFRTLLYQIWSQDPELIPEEYLITSSGLACFDHSWTVSELLKCLEQLGEQKDVSAQFCFFIDGLDEYDGDH